MPENSEISSGRRLPLYSNCLRTGMNTSKPQNVRHPPQKWNNQTLPCEVKHCQTIRSHRPFPLPVSVSLSHLCMRSLKDMASLRDSCKRSVMFVTCRAAGAQNNLVAKLHTVTCALIFLSLPFCPHLFLDDAGIFGQLILRSQALYRDLQDLHLQSRIQAHFDVLLPPRDLAFHPDVCKPYPCTALTRGFRLKLFRLRTIDSLTPCPKLRILTCPVPLAPRLVWW